MLEAMKSSSKDKASLAMRVKRVGSESAWEDEFKKGVKGLKNDIHSNGIVRVSTRPTQIQKGIIIQRQSVTCNASQKSRK